MSELGMLTWITGTCCSPPPSTGLLEAQAPITDHRHPGLRLSPSLSRPQSLTLGLMYKQAFAGQLCKVRYCT